MSSRWYQLYQQGNPQRRVFMPNLWMKLLRPEVKSPPNVVRFQVSIEMTKYDVKNYLEKIYNVKVADVRTRIALGKTRREKYHGYVVKDDDQKIAYVKMHEGETFQFPDLFPEKKDEEIKSQKKALNEQKKTYLKFLERNKDRPTLPGWYSL